MCTVALPVDHTRPSSPLSARGSRENLCTNCYTDTRLELFCAHSVFVRLSLDDAQFARGGKEEFKND